MKKLGKKDGFDQDDENVDENIDDVDVNSTEYFKDNNSICYILFDDNKTHVIESPKAKGDIIIPKFINFKSIEYIVTKICENSFANSFIESLYFPSDSNVKIIEKAAFRNSKIKKIFIPQSLIKLDDLWCKGANYLNEVEVDPLNQFFVRKD